MLTHQKMRSKAQPLLRATEENPAETSLFLPVFHFYRGNMSHCIHKSVATAPGKAILFGEHAVVFGTMAVAGALSDMRISAETSTVVGSEELVVILEDILDESTMAATVVHVDFKTIRSILSKHEDPFQPTNPTEEVKKSLESLFANTYAHAVCQGMMSIVYLVANLLGSVVWSDDTVGICMRIQSKGLPIGAGLGSSASVSVAVAASCLRLQALCQPSKCSRDELIINSCSVNAASVDDGNSGGSSDSSSSSSSSIGKGVSTATLVTPAKELLEVINDWAYASEILLHGQPSGLDNTTSCFGGLVQFSRRAEERFQLVARPPPLHILLVNTRVPRSTKKLVGAVRELHDRHPAVIQPILDSIHKIAEKFLSLISTFQANGHVESGPAYNDLITETGNLMEVNHHLLCGLGVGHPALSDVHDAAAAAITTTSTSVSSAAAVPAVAVDGDAITSGEKSITTATATAVTKGFACKLTGAGGGGCAIILSPVPYCEEDDICTSTSTSTSTSSGAGGGRGSGGETHTATIHTSQSTSCNSCSKSNVVLGGSGEGDVGGDLRRLRLLVASLSLSVQYRNNPDVVLQQVLNTPIVSSDGTVGTQFREELVSILRCILHSDPVWRSSTENSITVKTISGGLTNMLYLVKHCQQFDTSASTAASPKHVIVRLYGTGTSEYIDRNTENVVFAKLSIAGVGPAFHGLFLNGRVEGYLPATPLESSLEMGRGDIFPQIAAATAQLHLVDIPEVLTENWLWSKTQQFLSLSARAYSKNVRTSASNDDDDDDDDVVIINNEQNMLMVQTMQTEFNWYKACFSRLYDSIMLGSSSSSSSPSDCTGSGTHTCTTCAVGTADDNRGTIATTTMNTTAATTAGRIFGMQEVLCHNDLLSGNILVSATDADADADAAVLLAEVEDKGQHRSKSTKAKYATNLYLIDYEYAAYNYRAFDIANHLCEHCGYDFDVRNNFPTDGFMLEFLNMYTASIAAASAGCVRSSGYKCSAVPVDWFGTEFSRLFSVSDDRTISAADKREREAFISGLQEIVKYQLLASHLFWGSWALLQAATATIDFDYAQYAQLRLDGYFFHKQQFQQQLEQQLI